MRQCFSDTERLKQEAQNSVDIGLARLRRWWSQKYNMPPTHKYFVEQSVAELHQEMFEEWIIRRQDLRDDLDNVSGDAYNAMLEEIDSLTKALGEKVEVRDDLIDEWERDLAAGRMPDLNKGLEGV